MMRARSLFPLVATALLASACAGKTSLSSSSPTPAILHVGFGLSVSDTHGMKAMRREAVRFLAEGCKFRTDLFDTELVIRAERAGLPVVDIPVEVTETRPSRTPILRRVARSLVGLARMRWVLWRER